MAKQDNSKADFAGRYPHPPMRKLQIFSFDPGAEVESATTAISRCTIEIPWEEVEPGPVGEYVEVVDIDPSSGSVYDPVDLMDPSLLASNGLAPSTGNPQFHQQMVYAVAMKTILNFEQVLGRRIQWSERLHDDRGRYIRDPEKRYVQRLRIYPHAARNQNAYYSPLKKSLLFSYFNATTSDPRDELPGGVVFTCLSHDIIAHETTHAILDGLHRRLLDATNPDMLAFHEAFADLVAIFQHFTLPGVLLDQIQRTRGDLRTNNMLVQLATQFARSTGRGGALRNALGERGPDGRQLDPDPWAIRSVTRPHDRGAILVAAVFDAFLRIYEERVVDLRRIATGGTGELPEGDIHPDLAGRFAYEAARSSQHVLNMCIRALDYLPPVDITFGDYLRALITADADSYPEDPRRYRVAFVEAFRNRGIYPNDVRALAEDSLLWRPMDKELWGNNLRDYLPPPNVLRTITYTYDCEKLPSLTSEETAGEEANRVDLARQLLDACWASVETTPTSRGQSPRYRRYLVERAFARFIWRWIMETIRRAEREAPGGVSADEGRELASQLKDVGYHLGLDLEAVKNYLEHKDEKKMRLEVHAVRPTIRLRSDGRSKVELLVLLTQSLRFDLPPERVATGRGRDLSYKFRGGCTLLIDPENGMVRYAIGKNLRNEDRRKLHERFLLGRLASLGTAAVDRYRLRPRGAASKRPLLEPFALVHAEQEDGEVYE